MLNNVATPAATTQPHISHALATSRGAVDALSVHKNYKAHRAARKAAGRPDLRPHDLRHSLAFQIIFSGGTLSDVQAALHHKSVIASNRYAHLYPEWVERAISRPQKCPPRAFIRSRKPGRRWRKSFKLVPGAGVEPACRNYPARDFKSLVSTSFTTRARGGDCVRKKLGAGTLLTSPCRSKRPTPTADRDQTVSRRLKPSSRTTLNGEQPYSWDRLQPQDVMSRHRGAKPPRRYELLGEISLLSPAYLLSVERWPFHTEKTYTNCLETRASRRPCKVNWRYSRLLLRKRRGVPAAAQRLHQGRGRDEAPAENADCGALVVELGGLHRHHVDVAHGARLVLVGRQHHRFARCAHGLVLHFRLLFEDAQRGEVVLDLLEAGEHGLAVLRDGRIVGRYRLLCLRAPQAGVEDRLRERGADRPEAARRGEQIGGIRAAETAARRKRERRKVRGLRDADLRVRGGRPALGSGDVGPALEQLRGQAERNARHRHRERHGRDRELGGRLADEDRDRVLQLSALHAGIDRLRQRAFQLRLGLHHVHLRCDARRIAIARQLERLAEGRDGIVEQLLLRVEDAQMEIV